MARLTEKYVCRSCAATHQFPAYVFANWQSVVTHACECGAKTDLQRGRVVKHTKADKVQA